MDLHPTMSSTRMPQSAAILSRRERPRRGSRGSGRRTKIDAQCEDTIFQGGFCVANHREVLEVLLRLGDEQLPFFTSHWRQWTTLNRRCPFFETVDHVLRIEGGHEQKLVAPTPEQRVNHHRSGFSRLDHVVFFDEPFVSELRFDRHRALGRE